MDNELHSQRAVALVLSGGVGLGSYQAGAYERLCQAQFTVDWIAASSIGAVNAALIAGNAEGDRLDRLRQFWRDVGVSETPAVPEWMEIRRVLNWASAIRTRVSGAQNFFRPRLPSPFGEFRSFYSLAPMRRTLERLVDFSRINSGEIRLTVAATDIESGAPVYFDNAREKLTLDHLMASCGMLPEFAPVCLNGRTLGDGGLAANAPVEPLLADPAPRVIFVLDLFARDGEKPTSFMEASARKNELIFGNQTLRLLEYWRRTNAAVNGTQILYLSYRSLPREAASEKMFDLSSASVAGRWEEGWADMERAVAKLKEDNLDSLTLIR